MLIMVTIRKGIDSALGTCGVSNKRAGWNKHAGWKKSLNLLNFGDLKLFKKQHLCKI